MVIVPQAAREHPVPDTVQFTAVLELPVTAAENCCCPPAVIVADVGEIVTPTLAGAPIMTVALPNCVRSERDVAITATTGGFGAVAGAVYSPSEVISPQEMPPQPLPETLQITTLSDEPVAVNCT